MLNFGLGADRRKSTITLTQAREVQKRLENIGLYGKIFWNQEFFGGDFVEPEGDSELERVYVIWYGGNYHELAEIAVHLDSKNTAKYKVELLYTMMNVNATVLNIPQVAKAVEIELGRLIS